MTAQIPDKLDYKGQVYSLFTNPLDTLPYERQPAFVAGNTANWRGYVALWQIRDDRLYLKDIRGKVCIRPAEEGARLAKCGTHHRKLCEIRDAQLSDLFDGPVLADWFSGDLRVPQGRLLQYVHMGYGSQYERYLMITVARGVVEHENIVSGPAQISELESPGFLARLAKNLLGAAGSKRR